MNFWNVALFESTFVVLLLFGLGLVKLPKSFRRKKLVQGFPWGYYEGKLPNPEGDFFEEQNTDFLHNTGARFEGVPGLGILGEYSAHGFGEGMSDW
jgi:hypothetical protein